MFFFHCVTVLSLSHVTVCHSVYLFQLPLLEAEDSCNTLPVPYWCHVVSGSALIIFHSSSNSPQTAWCCIIPSDYLNRVVSSKFVSYPTTRMSSTAHTTNCHIRIRISCTYNQFSYTNSYKLRIQPILIYEFV